MGQVKRDIFGSTAPPAEDAFGTPPRPKRTLPFSLSPKTLGVVTGVVAALGGATTTFWPSSPASAGLSEACENNLGQQRANLAQALLAGQRVTARFRVIENYDSDVEVQNTNTGMGARNPVELDCDGDEVPDQYVGIHPVGIGRLLCVVDGRNISEGSVDDAEPGIWTEVDNGLLDEVNNLGDGESEAVYATDRVFTVRMPHSHDIHTYTGPQRGLTATVSNVNFLAVSDTGC